jgi:hypothetical protein
VWVKATSGHNIIERKLSKCSERHNEGSTLCSSFNVVVVFLLLKVTSMFTASFVTGVKLKFGDAFKTGLLPDVESNNRNSKKLQGSHVNH